ncbi:MFS transporter [Streptomyces odontomachi]|uniref:MFS transporter n=1 Tax=Streptomyces odontomachi TaxID=2944940 RepID=UPI00210E8B8E|nr:MFS transporter [Streptomyces sp. ODS25]
MAGPAALIRTPQDVVDLVNSGRAKGGNSFAIILIALGGIFIDAYDFTSLAFGVTYIKEDFHLSALTESVVTAAIMVGALLGALFGGYYADRLGRYKLFMADMLFFVVAALGCAVAPNLELLIAFRFLMGIGIGLDFPVALSFIAEYSATRGKGRAVNLWQPMWYVAVGTSFAILLPFYYLVPASGHDSLWRWAVGFGAVPALVVMLVRHRYMEESPSWAAGQGDLEGAARILRKSYGIDAAVAADAPPVPRPPSTGLTLGAFRKLFQGRYRRRTILAGVVGSMQSMQYFAVGFYLSQITATLFGKSTLTGIVGPMVFNFVFGVSGGFAGSALTQKWGSRTLALRGFACTTVLLVVIGLIGEGPKGVMAYVGGLLVGLFIFAHSGGPGAQGMTLATLSYPTSLRGAGTGLAQAMLRVGATAGLVFFPLMTDRFGLRALVYLAVAPFVGLVAALVIRWEPVGKDVDLEDYEQVPPVDPDTDPDPDTDTDTDTDPDPDTVRSEPEGSTP